MFTSLEFCLLLVPVFQLAYYNIYQECISESGMMAVQQTDKNEALEFLFALPIKTKLLCTMAILLLATVLFYSNMSAAKELSDVKLNLQTTVILSALAIFLVCYLSRPNKEKGVFLLHWFYGTVY